MTTSITLFLPGLTSALLNEVGNIPLDALSKLLSKAQKLSGPTTIENAIKTFFSGLPNGQIPSGALGALGRGLIQINDQGLWCRADPVECLVDHQSAYVLGNLNLELTQEEVATFESLLNQLLHQDGFDLKSTSPNEWYCKIRGNEDVIMNDLLEVLNKNMANLMPSGPDATYWHKLMTECQMIVQPSKVNEQRSILGKPLVSSLWFWGIGKLPQNIHSSFDAIFSNDACIRGLSICANRQYENLPEICSRQWIEKLNKRNNLMIDFNLYSLVKHQNHEKWLEYVRNYELNWFTPLLSMLKENHMDSLSLLCGDGQEFKITKKNLKFFWRKLKPIQQFAKTHHNESSQ